MGAPSYRAGGRGDRILLTQDPIGVAGGVNLYAYAMNNPTAFSDPYGLCTKADGWKDCNKMISAQQGAQVLASGIESGEWTYSQYFSGGNKKDPQAVDYGSRHLGDCTDFCRRSTQDGLGSDWKSSHKASTGMFKGGDHPGYTQVEASDAQAGDVVVQGGHAGLYIGTDKGGNVWGWANNGSPHRADGSGYNDGTTGARKFNEGSYGKGAPTFYRPIKEE